MNEILILIFTETFPVWERYSGAVPLSELKRLDQDGDWPLGVAAAAVARLNRDKTLANRLRQYSGFLKD
jgi:hypothetical protein